MRLPTKAIVTETGEARFLVQYKDTPRYSLGQFFGSVPTTGTQMSPVVTGVLYPDNYFGDRSRVAQLTLNGTVAPQVSWNGTFQGGGDSGTFAFTYQRENYERPSSLDRIAGTYAGTQTHDEAVDPIGYTVTLTIAGNGALTGSDSRGCQYSGNVSIVNPERNYYALKVNAANCAAQGGEYNGVAFFDSSNDGLTSLVYMANNGNSIWTGAVNRQGAGVVGISIADRSQAEGNSGSSAMNFTVLLDKAVATAVTVSFVTLPGTATADEDYTTVSGTLTIPAGSTTGTIAVPVIGDATVEADETFRVQLSNPSGNAMIVRGTAVGTITDDDASPRVRVSIADASVQELNSGSHVMTFILTFDRVPTEPISFDILTENGTAVAGSDFTAVSPPVWFPTGSETVQPFTGAMVNGDTDPEPDETFELRLANPSTNVEFGDAVAVGTILNDDFAPGVSKVSIGDAQVLEGDAGTTLMQFPVTIEPAATSDIVLRYSTQYGHASITDFGFTSGTNVTIPARTAATSIGIPVNGDLAIEADETFTLVVNSLSAAATVPDKRATGTILTDDKSAVMLVDGHAGPVGLRLDWSNVVEDDGAEVAWTVRLLEPVNRDVTIRYYTASGTATAGVDFEAIYQSSPASRTIPAGQTETTIGVRVKEDAWDEPSETFQVIVYPASAGDVILWGVAPLIGIIADDDAPAPPAGVGLYWLNQSGWPFMEGDSGSRFMRFTAYLNAQSASEVRVPYRVKDQYSAQVGASCGPGVDYVGVSGTLVFAPNDTQEDVLVEICGDDGVERDEVFMLQMYSPVNAHILGGEVLGFISNDDNYSLLSIDHTEVVEGPTGATAKLRFAVRRSEGIGVGAFPDVTATVRTVDKGTAEPTIDFTPRSQNLTFGPGETLAVFEVDVKGDAFFEGDEVMVAEFLNSAGGNVWHVLTHRAEAIGTIRDDD
jgi:chitinase